MTTRVRGKNVAVFLFIDGVWKLYACGRNCTLNRVTDFIETSASGSGKFKTFEPTANSFTGEITGVQHINKAGMVNLADFETLWMSQTKLLMRFQRTSDAGAVYTSEASFFISNLSDTGEHTDIAQYTVSLQGTGGITQIATATPSLNSNPVQTYYYNPTGGETSFTDASLIGKNIIAVFKDGIEFNVITTGTPVGKEVFYNSATGYFEYSQSFDAAEQDSLIIYQGV